MKKPLFQVLTLATAILISSAQAVAENSTGLKPLSLGEIKAGGWMKNQIERDITSGYISVYDQIQPSLNENTFGPEKRKNYSISSTGEWETRRETWWPGEHEGYMAEIVVRSAYLTANKEWLKKAKTALDYVIENQGPDGYIGIYDEECRLDNLLNENGELWTQSRMMAALLAYYEYSGDEKYFNAAKRAVDLVIDRYTKSKKTYFQQPKPNGGGLTHGLMYIETLEWMHRHTNDIKYLNFADWLYMDYSNAEKKLRNTDCQLESLLDKNKLFSEHSVHVAEHLRTVFWLAKATGKADYMQAAENALLKYKYSQSPTGALVMDKRIHESVAGNYGSAWLPYEYCTLTEGVISLSSAMQKFNYAYLGDVVENIAFNAAQGARLADGKAISYATIDNRFDALAVNNDRYQIAACHSTACCQLQAAKLMPYYVANMWAKESDNSGIALLLYGESTVKTVLNNTTVTIKEETQYPFSNKVKLTIDPQKDVHFKLTLRNPDWSTNTNVTVSGAEVKRSQGWIIVEKTWKKGDVIELTFNDNLVPKRFTDNEMYFQKGALVYALPIDDKRTVAKDYGNGFVNIDVAPANVKKATEIFDDLRVPSNMDAPQRAEKNKGVYKFEPNTNFKPEFPFDIPFGFVNVKFVKKSDAQVQEMKLVPLGSTVLRKVSFKEEKFY
jgi:uncharacterized protein